MSRTTAVLLLLALCSLPIAAQSFDCRLAQSPREQTICADTRLQALDAELAANYKALRAQLSPESAALVQSDQREWLTWLDHVCPAGKGFPEDQTPGSPADSLAGVETRCLQNQYFTRVHDLKITAKLGTSVIFPRAHFLFKQGGASSIQNPGFGYGSLRWPQIDRPNSAQTAWNDAIEKEAARRAVGFAREKSAADQNATFETSVDASGTIEGYFNIEAANDRLIVITLTDGNYGWGAAHPLTEKTSFVWWFGRDRQLTVPDVFLPNSGWQEKLAALTIASLRSQPDLKAYLSTDLDQPVKQTVSDPNSWTPTRDGLTITFGQYAVGPYVLGMPQAHVRWTDLKPYLEPSLNPSTLPVAIPRPNS